MQVRESVRHDRCGRLQEVRNDFMESMALQLTEDSFQADGIPPDRLIRLLRTSSVAVVGPVSGGPVPRLAQVAVPLWLLGDCQGPSRHDRQEYARTRRQHALFRTAGEHLPRRTPGPIICLRSGRNDCPGAAVTTCAVLNDQSHERHRTGGIAPQGFETGVRPLDLEAMASGTAAASHRSVPEPATVLGTHATTPGPSCGSTPGWCRWPRREQLRWSAARLAQ